MTRGAQRQRLNLSAHALSIVDSDIQSLGTKDSRSGFINEIMRKFAPLSKADLKATTEQYEAEFEALILKQRYREKYTRDPELAYYEYKKGKLDPSEKQVIKTLAASKARKELEEIRTLPKQEQITIRLQNDVYDSLINMQTGDGIFRSSGEFIKAVVEDYASKPYFEREAIIYRDILEVLQAAVENDTKNRLLLQITLDKTALNSKFDVKPYKVLADTGRNYHYLVGLSRPLKTQQMYTPASFRLSRIVNVTFKPKTYGSGRITKMECNTIESAIKQSGVQYLLGNPQKTVIHLTQEGMALYNVIIHGRPTFSEHYKLEDGTYRLTFDCSKKQIVDYFFKFGAIATIERPIELTESFRDKYHDAYNAYNQNLTDLNIP